MTPERKKLVWFAVPALLSLIVDQITKQWARAALGPEGSGKVISVIGEALSFRYAENPGVAFSMLRNLPGGRYLLAGLAVLALVLVVRYLRATPINHTRIHAALGLIAGGAIGNLVDRVLHGVVVDFVLVDLDVWPLDPWPVFNVADIVLVVGVGLMILDLVLTRRADGAQRAAGPATPAAPPER
jgi:signal peptidase II